MSKAPLTISAAARLCHCDRRTLQRAIHAGRLHLDAEHCLSREELIAVGYLIADTPQDTPQSAPQDTPLLALLARLTTAVEGVWQELRALREQQPPMPLAAPQDTPHVTPQGAPRETPQEEPRPAPQPSSQIPAL